MRSRPRRECCASGRRAESGLPRGDAATGRSRGLSWPWWAGTLAATPYLSAPAGALLFGRGLPLHIYDPPADDAAPLVSVVIPARNEADRIARCVGSVLATAYPKVEIIVVDDRSVDGTARIVADLAARDPRLTLLSGEELPRGWFGKPWACWQGAQAARGSLLLFTDADTWHGPELLGRAVGMLHARRADFVSLLQRQEMRTFWERIVQPHLFALIGMPVLLATAGNPARINERQSRKHAIANGQFILVTRESYDAVGGHRAVKGEVVEDLMLARRYAEAARTRWIANAMEEMSTRMYRSLGEIVEGWSKNLFMAGQILWGRAGGYVGVAALLALVALGLLPFALLALAAAGAGPAALAFGAAGSACGMLAGGIFLRRNGERVWPAVFSWLGQLVLLWILIRSTVRGRRRIEWKGRTYTHT